MKKELELLAPAGSFETFKAVICAGADAVYAGGNLFGARAYANNFTEEELEFSKLAITSTYNSLSDSMAATEDFYNSQTVMNKKYSVCEYIERINATTKEEVVKASNEIVPDMVFFLKGSAEN